MTTPLPVDESCVIIVGSDGLWDALLTPAVDALVRGTMANGPDSSSRIMCEQALTTRHAYSSDGDEQPIDDTTVVCMRVEHGDDPFKAEEACCG